MAKILDLFTFERDRQLFWDNHVLFREALFPAKQKNRLSAQLLLLAISPEWEYHQKTIGSFYVCFTVIILGLSMSLYMNEIPICFFLLFLLIVNLLMRHLMHYMPVTPRKFTKKRS